MENWLKSKKGKNPWLAPRRAARHIHHSGNQLRQRSPSWVFKDSDRDGVLNGFDCKPFNKRRQDVLLPPNYGGGVQDMLARQEGSRQYKIEYGNYLKQLKENEKLEKEQQKVMQEQEDWATAKKLLDKNIPPFFQPREIVEKWRTLKQERGAMKEYQANRAASFKKLNDYGRRYAVKIEPVDNWAGYKVTTRSGNTYSVGANQLGGFLTRVKNIEKTKKS